MLENLDKVNWANLTHAYGEASDVPALLLELASPDAATRKEAHYYLYGNIIHQGMVYEDRIGAFGNSNYSSATIG